MTEDGGRRRAARVYAASYALVFATARLASAFTARGVGSDWYAGIRPALTPPDIVFPVAWTVLYLLLAAALGQAWLGTRGRARRYLAGLFGLNLALNVAWTGLYFGLRAPAAAFPALLALWATIVLIMAACIRARRPVFFLLLPYLGWVTFAGLLNRLSF